MRKLQFISAFLFLFCTIFSTSLNASDSPSYIQKFKDIAISEMHRSGIPASITLAQAIHESAWGKGTLALNSNNYFGIKCKDYWTGPKYYIKDDDYENGELIKSCFRAYESIEDSFKDHSDFLRDNPRYKILFQYDITDYKSWARGLQKCTYATDPKYAAKLIRTIEQYQLYQYDSVIKPQEAPVPPQQPIGAPSFHIPDYIPVTTATPVAGVSYPEVTPEQLIIEEENLEVPAAYVLPDDYQRGANLQQAITTTTAFTTERPVVLAAPKPDRLPEERRTYQPEVIIRMTYAGNGKAAQLSRRPRVSSSRRR